VGKDLDLGFHAKGVGYIHPKLPDSDIYFVANTTPYRRELELTARGGRLPSEIWDPSSGKITDALLVLGLEPYASRFVVFKDGVTPARVVTAVNAAAQAPRLSLELKHPWTLTFPGNPPRVFKLGHLVDWRDLPGLLHYSGTAEYETVIDVPSGEQDCPLVLDFGRGRPVWPRWSITGGFRAWLEPPIREAAVVYVNGERAGSVFSPPYEVDVTAFLKPGPNAVRIEVANLALNEESGRPLPDYAGLRRRYGDRFSDDDTLFIVPERSGLLGPVRLRAAPGSCNSRRHDETLGPR
jgi:hypothetical protein